MVISPATTQGGRINTVHNEFDNGLVFAVVSPGGYDPVVFSWCDVFGTRNDSVLAAGKWYHDRLMQTDGGMWERRDDSVPVFQWNTRCKEVIAQKTLPDGTTSDIWRWKYDNETGAVLCGLRFQKTISGRYDREIWQLGMTEQNKTGAEDLIGFTQENPQYCPQQPTNHCGYKELE